MQPELLQIIIRLFVAAILGGLIGLERDIHGRSAGLRTQMLVSLGSALFALVSISVVDLLPENYIDPGRIASQIITGIGFLGAGSIIKSGFSVRGLTTAASLWVAAGIGMAVGMGFYIIAIITTLLVLITLLFTKPFGRLYKRETYRLLSIVTENHVDVKKILELVTKEGHTILHADIDRDYDHDETQIRLSLKLSERKELYETSEHMFDLLEKESFKVKSISWDHHEVE